MNAKEVIQLLENPTVTSHNAFHVQQKIENEASVSEMIAALQESQNADVREVLCDMLGKLANIQAVPALIDALHDSSEAVRGSAAEALGKIGDPEAGEALLEQYFQEKGDDGIRQLIAIALGAVGYRPAIPFLIQALSSPSHMLRLCAAWGLRSLKATEAKDALQRALEQETDDYTILEMKKVLRSIDPSYRWDG